MDVALTEVTIGKYCQQNDTEFQTELHIIFLQKNMVKNKIQLTVCTHKMISFYYQLIILHA